MMVVLERNIGGKRWDVGSTVGGGSQLLSPLLTKGTAQEVTISQIKDLQDNGCHPEAIKR